MTEDDTRPPVACRLTEPEMEDRRTSIETTLANTYEDVETLDNGVTIRFSHLPDSLPAVAAFVTEEHQCCPFADYRIETTPPYDGVELTITGPDGTRELFREGLVDALETA